MRALKLLNEVVAEDELAARAFLEKRKPVFRGE